MYTVKTLDCGNGGGSGGDDDGGTGNGEWDNSPTTHERLGVDGMNDGC